MTARLRVQFVHGLESSPSSSKALYLGAEFDAVTPAMDTSDFEGAVAVQAAELARFRPDVLVGSSFGGAVVVALLGRGVFSGPTVLLAPAHRHYGVAERIPEGVPVVIAHGSADDIVALAGSEALARTGTPGLVELVVVDDGHRLASLVESGRLGDLVRRAASLGG